MHISHFVQITHTKVSSLALFRPQSLKVRVDGEGAEFRVGFLSVYRMERREVLH